MEQRKTMIFATNAAEMSLNLRPLWDVVSTCQVNRRAKNKTGLEENFSTFTSQEEARQQGGCAGRLPGGRQFFSSSNNQPPMLRWH
jgi:HrpA-like RNA helicase